METFHPSQPNNAIKPRQNLRSSHSSNPSHLESASNIVERLRLLVGRAKQMGYGVRMEPLAGRGTSWCEVNGRIYLFVDLSQTTHEQCSDIESILNRDQVSHRIVEMNSRGSSETAAA
jgi:hypothetical protein